MDPQIVGPVIGALGGIAAAIIGKTRVFDGLFRRSELPDLRGVWLSEWVEDGKAHKETIHISRQRGRRVFGTIDSDTTPGHDCRMEGHFNGRFLTVIWYPGPSPKDELIDDYGCYFFEKTADGDFEGSAEGFLSHRNRRMRFTHTLKRMKGAV